MNQTEAMRLFEEANRLWFGQARYNKVLPLYREALKHDPTDPVILYQLANVLWAFEQFDEVKEVVAKIEQHQERLSDRGKKILAKEKQRLLAPSPFKRSLPIPADEIDLEKLESMDLTHGEWLDVAYDAESRRMFNLAEYALDRSMPFIDPDTEKEKRQLDQEDSRAFRELEVMRKEAEK